MDIFAGPGRRLGVVILVAAGGCSILLPWRATWAQPASVDRPGPAALAPIVVSAQKRDQLLQDVPAAIAVISGDDLQAEGAQGLDALPGMMTGLGFQPMGQSGLMPPVMRGLSANVTSFSSSVALVVDGVPTLRAQGFDDPLLGVEQVEVLKGPQSTLYGRNAEAGVISIQTRKPGNEPYAMVSGNLGNHGRRGLQFDVSTPVSEDSLYIGVAGGVTRQDGFIDNTYRDEELGGQLRRSGRLVLRWTPGVRTDVVLRHTRADYDDDASLWGSPSAPRAEVRSGTDGWNRSRARTLSLDVAHEFESGLRLRAISARNTYKDDLQQDTDFMPADMMHIGRDHDFKGVSQELRLEGTAGEASWLAGLYLDRDTQDLRFAQKTPMALVRTEARQKSRTSALFTHWTVPLGGAWSVTAGGRIEHSSVDFDLPGESGQSRGWTRFSPKLAVHYAWRPQTAFYASVSEGYRAGGFNAFAPAAYRDYDPEKVLAFELGAKGHAFDERLQYGASLYYMTIRQMQVQQMGLPGQVFMTNAASGRSLGAEFDVSLWLDRGWQLQAGLAFNQSRFRRFQDGAADYGGNRNPFSPQLSGYAGLRYQSAGGWYAQARVQGAGKVYLDAANDYRRAGFGIVNLSAGYQFDTVDATLYVNNVADRTYDAIGFLNGLVTIYSPPREVGLRLTWRM